VPNANQLPLGEVEFIKYDTILSNVVQVADVRFKLFSMDGMVHILI
jgi:hypothetical protein